MRFLLPALLINVVIILIPALLTIAMAFVDWDGLSTPTFVGLDNFRTIFADPVFFSALLNNIKWTLIFLVIPIAMGLVAGSLLLVVRRGRTFFQIVYFLPVIIATVVVARVWQGMIYNPESGLVGWLKLYGIVLADPLAHPPTALYAVATVDVWHWWGFLAVIFFAALRQVDMAQIDAARARLEGLSVYTPLLACEAASPGKSLRLKLENLQRIGSFKIRPIGNAVLSRSTACGVRAAGAAMGARASASRGEETPLSD